MGPSERPEFSEAITALATTFNREASEALLMGYWLGLQDLPLASVKRAVGRTLAGSKFMPTPAELREMAGEMLPEHRAVKAWQVLLEATKKHCPYHSIHFDDPLINAVLRNLAGGERAWEVWAEMVEAEEEKWLRKDFERIYVSLARSGVSAPVAAPLIGFHDRDNAENEYHESIKKPRLIKCGLPPLPLGTVALPDKRSKQKLLEDVGAIPQ